MLTASTYMHSLHIYVQLYMLDSQVGFCPPWSIIGWDFVRPAVGFCPPPSKKTQNWWAFVRWAFVRWAFVRTPHIAGLVPRETSSIRCECTAAP